MKSKFRLYLVIVVVLTWACEKDVYYRGTDAALRFSADTVFFDTVFTSIGSATRYFRVINPHREDVLVSSIRLAGNLGGFRLNIDGLPGNRRDDVLIPGKDSIFIFVEVTIDPLGINQPMVIRDSVIFDIRGQVQDVDLLAVGQDVHLLNGAIVTTGEWTNDKPYLIYNSMLVDTGEVLTIHEGARLHFHRGSTMYVIGRLLVYGTVENPVIFQGDRLEKMYGDIPGQWGGIYFINGSAGNIMENVVVKNANAGVHLGNLFTSFAPPDLTIKNAEIRHMTYAGISSIAASLQAENTVVADCGMYNLLVTVGGDYRFIHCTFANYWPYSNRITPAIVLTDYYRNNDVQVSGPLNQAYFGNCIIHGGRHSEFYTDKITANGIFSFRLDHCLVKISEQVNTSDPVHFGVLYKNADPGFTSADKHDYTLDTLAFAKDRGAYSIGLEAPFDLKGYDRLMDAAPDLGAFERIEK